MYVMPPRPPKKSESAERGKAEQAVLEREKIAKNLLARGTSPEVIAKKIGLSEEQVRSLI